jgi:hypothetical protein
MRATVVISHWRGDGALSHSGFERSVAMTRWRMAAMQAAMIVVGASACNGDGGVPVDPRVERVRINELMPSNQTACADDQGEFDDWIELVSLDDADVNLDGFSLSDDRTALQKAPLDELTIPAGGRLVLYADGTPAQGPLHLPFRLSATGEELILSVGEAIVDEVAWTTAVTDTSLGRFPDGTGDVVSCSTSTCGAANGASCPSSP